MRAPTFQLMPKMRFIPAPLPEILPKVKKRQEKKTVIRDAGNPYRTDGTSPKMRKSSVQEGAERAESWSQSEMPSAELQTQISTEKTVSTGDEKLDYFMQKMRERVYASHLAEAKEEQDKEEASIHID